MILLLQVLLGAAVAAWHQFGGLPPLVAIPLAAYGAAFLGLWRKPGKRSDQRPPFRNPSRPPPAGRCRDCLAELELAERFNGESG